MIAILNIADQIRLIQNKNLDLLGELVRLNCTHYNHKLDVIRLADEIDRLRNT
jgi:selenocysteine lyase/cysteine desulfurase